MRAPVEPFTASEIAAGRKWRGVEWRRRAVDHGRDRNSASHTRGEADVLVSKAQPETGMPWRGPDHRQAVGQRRPGSAPGFADGIAEFDNAPRRRDYRIELRIRRRRVARGQLDAGRDANSLLHRAHQKTGFAVMDRTQQGPPRIRLELLMVAALEGQRNAIAERSQQIGGPRTQRDDDMACLDRAVAEHDAPGIAVPRDGADFRAPDLSTGACKHLRIC